MTAPGFPSSDHPALEGHGNYISVFEDGEAVLDGRWNRGDLPDLVAFLQQVFDASAPSSGDAPRSSTAPGDRPPASSSEVSTDDPQGV